MRLLTEQRGDVGLIRVSGEIDAAAVSELLATLDHATRTSRAVEVDLRRVTHLDRAGVQALRRAQLTAGRGGCHVVIRRAREVQRAA